MILNLPMPNEYMSRGRFAESAAAAGLVLNLFPKIFITIIKELFGYFDSSSTSKRDTSAKKISLTNNNFQSLNLDF